MKKNEMQILEQPESYFIQEFGWKKSQFEIIQNTYFSGLSINEIKIFAHICRHHNLDPILKHIYPVMRSGKMCIQTSIDGFRLIADRTKRYSPGKETNYVHDKEGKIICATSYVKKQTHDGTWHEMSATAYFDEYKVDTGHFWKKMPHVMIAKCAEALALRKAFPAELSGIYSDDEMMQSSNANDANENCILALNDENKPSTPKNVPIDEKLVQTIDEKVVQTIDGKQLIHLENMLKNTSDDYIDKFMDHVQKCFGRRTLSCIPVDKFDHINMNIEQTIKSLEGVSIAV